MKIDILTLFPEMFELFNYSIIGRAIENGIVSINTHNIRDYSEDKHKKVDDYTYGGGEGMVMAAQPVVDCIENVKSSNEGMIIFLGPRGKTFNQNIAKKLVKQKELIFLCGHYEGIDERIYDYVDMELSVGDYIVTGGEMACIPIVDSICRLVPGVLSCENSFINESFYNGFLEYPQYTRPSDFRGKKVPDVLLSGNHERIRKWRRQQSLIITKKYRPDLFNKIILNKEDKRLLDDYYSNKDDE